MHDSSFCRKAFTLCICLLFSGCAASLSDANVKGEKAVTENISLADSMNLTQPSDGSSDAAQMKIISSANGIIASSILGNEKGCYEVFDRPANGGNLLYTDYATRAIFIFLTRLTVITTMSPIPVIWKVQLAVVILP